MSLVLNMVSLRASKTPLVLTLIFITLLPWNRAYDIRHVEKRQIGVLARTGALPQGKRSVEVLARNGELPHQTNNKKEQVGDITLDLLIRELESGENLSRLRVQALSEKILEEREAEQNKETKKRSVAALARNGELPQKRLSEEMARSGYLVRPPQEMVQPPPDLLDPDDFLADSQPSLIPEYLDERAPKIFFLRPDKRTVGSARNFLLPVKSLELETNLYNKKNLASLARDGGLSTLRHHLLKERGVDNFYQADLWDDDRKTMDASRNLIKREIKGICWKTPEKYGNKNRVMEATNKGNSNINGQQKVQDEYPPQNPSELDYEDFSAEFYNEGNPIEKRFLGRIPQLGRIHQKVQSPSARRRPHLRPNWL